MQQLDSLNPWVAVFSRRVSVSLWVILVLFLFVFPVAIMGYAGGPEDADGLLFAGPSLVIGLLLSSIADFLIAVPRAAANFMSPNESAHREESGVTPGSFISEVHSWALRLNAKHLLILAGMLVLSLVFGYFDMALSRDATSNPTATVTDAVLLAFMIWLFFLETGVAIASVPRLHRSVLLVLLFWVIPVFVAVIRYGLSLTTSAIIADFDKTHWNVPIVFITPQPHRYAMTYALFLIPPVLAAHAIGWLGIRAGLRPKQRK